MNGFTEEQIVETRNRFLQFAEKEKLRSCKHLLSRRMVFKRCYDWTWSGANPIVLFSEINRKHEPLP